MKDNIQKLPTFRTCEKCREKIPTTENSPSQPPHWLHSKCFFSNPLPARKSLIALVLSLPIQSKSLPSNYLNSSFCCALAVSLSSHAVEIFHFTIAAANVIRVVLLLS